MTELRVNTIKGQNGTSSPSISKIVSPVNSIVQTLTCSTIDVKDLSSVTGSINAATLGVAGDGTALTTATSSSGTLNANVLATTNFNLGGTAIKTKPPFATFAYAWDGSEVIYSQMHNLQFGGYKGVQGDTDGYQPTDAVDDVPNNGRFDYFTFGGQLESIKNFQPQVFQMLFITPPPNNEYTVVISGERRNATRSNWTCFLSGEDIEGYPSFAGGKRLRERFTVQCPTLYASDGWVHGMVFA